MILQTQSILLPPSLSISKKPTLYKPQFVTTNKPSSASSQRKSSSIKTLKTLKCSSVSVISEPTHLESTQNKPYPAEVSRTIMELSSVGTLSTLTHDGFPLGFGVRFAVDLYGTPVLCLNSGHRHFDVDVDSRITLHVQLEQSKLRTPQCTIRGSISKPEDEIFLKKLHSAWTKRFGEKVDEDLIYCVDVERVLQMDNFNEDGVWVNSCDYKSAQPDPLRDCAEKIVEEINTNNMEDVHRFCNIYADLDFLVSDVKVIWVDRLGFDMRVCSPHNNVFEVRIPFPREVIDEKGAKSSFNGLSQLAWEVEKNYHAPEFTKVKQMKRIK